jgi:uncharacterized repeat protein (TIGR03803 family)
MKTVKYTQIIVLAVSVLIASNSFSQTFTVLHNFTNCPDGQSPLGLVMAGNILYGITSEGGISDQESIGNGMVFSVNIDGTGFRVLHTFTARSSQTYTNSDGASPSAGLLLSGSTLYGTTAYGGPNGHGTVFSMNTNGTGFKVIYNFTGSGMAIVPLGPLAISCNKLYGTSEFGGTYNYGTVFSLNTDGAPFTLLHSFTSLSLNPPYTNADGAEPFGGLVQYENTLYGTTVMGGTWGNGTVFAVNTNGTGFTVLHCFTNTDGARPQTTLTLSGSTLYGTTAYGGTNGDGTVFAMNADGTGFNLLHNFIGTDGGYPATPLTLYGNTLYGATDEGGTNDYGTVFEVNTDGTDFAVLQNVANIWGWHPNPMGNLVVSKNILYGTTENGGANGDGTVFCLQLPTFLTAPELLANGQFQFSFNTATGVNYAVQYSTNLTQWFPFVTVGGIGLPLTLIDPNTASSQQRFYRIILSPQ